MKQTYLAEEVGVNIEILCTIGFGVKPELCGGESKVESPSNKCT